MDKVSSRQHETLDSLRDLRRSSIPKGGSNLYPREQHCCPHTFRTPDRRHSNVGAPLIRNGNPRRVSLTPPTHQSLNQKSLQQKPLPLRSSQSSHQDRSSSLPPAIAPRLNLSQHHHHTSIETPVYSTPARHAPRGRFEAAPPPAFPPPYPSPKPPPPLGGGAR